MSIGFMAAATAFAPSLTMACASRVTVVVPSPASSPVFNAACFNKCAPMFSKLSASSISLATVAPSLLMRGGPNDLSSTTLWPLGPSVTFTASARTSTPRSIFSRASVLKRTSVAAMILLLQCDRDAEFLCCFRLCPRLAFDDPENIGLFKNEAIFAVDDHVGTHPFSEQYLIADLDIQRDDLAGLIARAWSNSQDLAFDRFFLRRIRNDDAARGLFLSFDTSHQDAVVQGSEASHGRGPLIFQLSHKAAASGSKRP